MCRGYLRRSYDNFSMGVFPAIGKSPRSHSRNCLRITGGATHDPAEQTVGWAFAVLSLADALERDVTDLDLQFDSFIDGFVEFRERLTTDESIHLLKRFMSYPSPEFIPPTRTIDELLKDAEVISDLVKNDPEKYAFLKMGEKLVRRQANRE